MIAETMTSPEFWVEMTAIGLYAMAFSKSVRREVYERQHGRCAVCGEHHDRLETHHVIPHCMNGTDDEDNAVGLCHEDHMFADRMAIRHHIFYPDIMEYDKSLVGLNDDE